MVPKFNKGITLIEIIVVIFIVALFSVIIIANFPGILRQLALSRVTYKLAQDLRRAQDLALSGVALKDKNENAINVKGYGAYFASRLPPPNQRKEYILYADVDGDQKYADGLSTLHNCYNSRYTCCNGVDQTVTKLATDCVLEVVDISKENSSLYFKTISPVPDMFNLSVNFIPPNPIVNITAVRYQPDHVEKAYPEISIHLGILNETSTRTVLVNTSGLIEVR